MTKDEIKDEIIKKQDELIDYIPKSFGIGFKIKYINDVFIQKLRSELTSLKTELEKEKVITSENDIDKVIKEIESRLKE